MYWHTQQSSLFYESVGQGIPILMLHGYAVDHRILKGCMEPLFASHRELRARRIYLDLPGMGQSSASNQVRCADDMLKLLCGFVDEVIGSQPFLVVGESYGGYLARGLFHQYSQHIQAALLLCPCIIPDAQKRTLPDFAVLESTHPTDDTGFCTTAVIQTEETWTRYQDEVMSGLQAGDQEFLLRFQQDGYGFSFDVDTPAQPYPFPTLFLTGRQDDCVGYVDAWTIQCHYQHASFVTLDRAGHNLQIDQPMWFERLVGDWLAGVL